MKNKLFKVVSVSKNVNSFGLRGHVLVARNGEAWEVGANHLNSKKIGEVVSLHGSFSDFEIPRRLPTAPKNVVDEVWKQ